MTFLIDTHCHLDLPDFDDDLEAVFKRANLSGFQRFIIPGIELSTIEKIKKIAGIYPAVFFASGIHPNNAADLVPDWAERVRTDAAEPKCVAIGEIGLDYYREYCPHKIQREVFTRQLSLAEELGLPVITHCRAAFDELWPLLRDWLDSNSANRAVLHAFDEDADTAREVLAHGCFLGIGGTYTYTKKNERRLEILRIVPLERILLETDCPYLTPVPHRGERNEPAFCHLTAERVAAVKDISFETVAAVTTANAEGFFNLK